MNIKARLTLRFTLLVASIMLISRLGSYYYYDQYREQQFFAYLKERATTIVPSIAKINNGSNPEKARQEQEIDNLLLTEYVTVYNNANKVVYNSGKEPFMVPPVRLAQARQGQEVKYRQGAKEIFLIRFFLGPQQEPWVVAYATDLNELNEHDTLWDILAIGWLISLFLISWAGWIFAKDALRPVSVIIGEVNNISAGNLHERLQVGSEKDELTKLAATFNLMLNRLEQAFSAQKSFVSNASHELRTPLAVIMGEVEVTLLNERSNEVYRESLKRILNEVKSLNGVVNGLLELARADTGVSASFKKIRIDEILWLAQSHVMQKDQNYSVEIKFEHFPETEEELLLRGDQTLLEMAFANLMENACKYSENKRVEVLLEVQPKMVKVHFKDQGIGIGKEHLPQLFDTFYRINSTQSPQGYGIGLALVKRIIDLHHGQIDLTSEPGVGSTFVISFPLI
ncbi:sensor histidine kinase [Telluribacter sp.]|jgi:signal transduction histidine kinase|uniref:sensor histidine kinase n=1 Tax=Telluribacter sp. TaxID=1978767 RepID=UPI002E0FA533|nr:ATP-binding protein [Telluribacter sp.]